MKNKNNTEWIVFALFTIIGIFFLGAGLLSHQIYNNRVKNWISTKAEIIKIEDKSVLDKKHYVEVEFFVKKRVYQTELNRWISTMKIGDYVNILYNSENPNLIIMHEYPFSCFIFCILGGIFSLVGMIPLVHLFSKSQIKRKLKNSGKKVEATIDEVTRNMLYAVNGKYPNIIKCSYIDSQTKKVYNFKSENIWIDIKQILEEKNINKINVYMDYKNEKIYYMDIEEILEK